MKPDWSFDHVWKIMAQIKRKEREEYFAKYPERRPKPMIFIHPSFWESYQTHGNDD